MELQVALASVVEEQAMMTYFLLSQEVAIKVAIKEQEEAGEAVVVQPKDSLEASHLCQAVEDSQGSLVEEQVQGEVGEVRISSVCLEACDKCISLLFYQLKDCTILRN